MSNERARADRDVAKVRGPGDGKSDSFESLLLITHVVYGLHAFALLSGIVGSVAILVSFLASVPSVVAVVINYVKRSAVRGTWLESHFRWQIRTFWFALLWYVVALLGIVSIVGVLPGLVILLVTSIWVVYRIIRGWWSLVNGRTMPDPG